MTFLFTAILLLLLFASGVQAYGGVVILGVLAFAVTRGLVASVMSRQVQESNRRGSEGRCPECGSSPYGG